MIVSIVEMHFISPRIMWKLSDKWIKYVKLIQNHITGIACRAIARLLVSRNHVQSCEILSGKSASIFIEYESTNSSPGTALHRYNPRTVAPSNVTVEFNISSKQRTQTLSDDSLEILSFFFGEPARHGSGTHCFHPP